MLPRGSSVAAITLLTLMAACDDGEGPAPRIDRLLPGRGAPGTAVDIFGERFEATAGLALAADAVPGTGADAATGGEVDECDRPREVFVHFGARAVGTTCWTATRISTTVPDDLHPGWTTVVVTVEGVPSPPVTFEITE